MDIEVRSYEGFADVPFGSHSERVKGVFGEPGLQRKNRSGETLYDYDCFIVCFDSDSGEFRECTFTSDAQLQLNENDVDWSADGLKSLCMLDGNPQLCFGTIVLLRLGVTLTGVSDNEAGSRALSIFRRGDWDEFADEMNAFDVSGDIGSTDE